MVWNINDATDSEGGSNCSLVAAAALVSHLNGTMKTSGAVARSLWISLLKTHKQDPSIINAVAEMAPTDFSQAKTKLLDWSEFDKHLIRADANEKPKYFEPYLEPPKNEIMTKFKSRSNEAEYINKLNGFQFMFVSQLVGTHSPISEKNLNGSEFIDMLKDRKSSAIFAAHIRSLGHWLFGYTKSIDSDKTDKPTSGIKFVDYQPSTPVWSDYPFVGLSTTADNQDGSDSAQLYDIIIVPNKDPYAAGLPTQMFSGTVEKAYSELINKQLSSQPSTSDKALHASVEPELSSAQQSATKAATGSKPE